MVALRLTKMEIRSELSSKLLLSKAIRLALLSPHVSPMLHRLSLRLISLIGTKRIRSHYNSSDISQLPKTRVFRSRTSCWAVDYHFFFQTLQRGLRTDGLDLLELAETAGINAFSTRAGFDAFKGGKLPNGGLPYLGVFTPGHMSYEVSPEYREGIFGSQ